MTIAARRHLFHATIALSAVFLVAAPASSLVQPAHSGHAFFPGDPCFSIGSQAVENTCSDGPTHAFVIPIATTNNANHIVAARYAGNGSNATSCQPVALSGGGFSKHGALSVPVTSHTPQVVTFSNVFVATDETLQVECFVAKRLPSGVSGFVVSIGF